MTKTYKTSSGREATWGAQLVAKQGTSVAPVLADNRSSMLAQRKIRDMLGRSPRMAQQKMMAESLRASSGMKAQLQPKAANGGPAQLYKAAAAGFKAVGLAYSTENEQYHLKKTKDNNTIAGDAKAAAPLNSIETPLASPAGHSLTGYEPDGKFLADCLHTAEEIMQGEKLARGKLRSKAAGSAAIFGSTKSGKGVWDVASDVDKKSANKNADAGMGSAFAIVAPKPLELEGGLECQYHAAAVVASDGTDRITLEVFGDDRKRRVATAQYNVYDTDPTSKHTFHDRWTKLFQKGSTTITLCPIGASAASEEDSATPMTDDAAEAPAAAAASSS